MVTTTATQTKKPLKARTRIGGGGRLVIPVEMRRALGMEEGVAVVLRVEDGELRVWTVREGIRRAQELARPYLTAGPSVVDELIAERRAENARDEAEARAMDSAGE